LCLSNCAALILVARLIFGGVFAMAAVFKFLGMGATAGYIAAAGFPLALLLAWIAAFFESALAIALWTGAFFSEAAPRNRRLVATTKTKIGPAKGRHFRHLPSKWPRLSTDIVAFPRCITSVLLRSCA
jgi:hypothetical protein